MILPPLTVTIVTFNSGKYIRRCLESVLAQDYPSLRIVVVDNASADGTPAILREFESSCQVVYNLQNTGFAGGQNQAIRLARTPWVLPLNPDIVLTPGFFRKLVIAGEIDPTTGTVCGKLLSMSPSGEIADPPLIDSTGMFLTPQMRHLDRGSHETDRGQYEEFEFVFGATGAAVLYRQAMIDDVSIDGEFYDEDFFAYREDADVSWRAQLLGWRCLYCPRAIAYHVRTVLPENRSALPAMLNMHSVKNRWLLRIKNMTGDLYRHHLLPITIRDLLVVAGVILKERTSLPGLVFVWKNRKRLFAKRREIMRRRKATDREIAEWVGPRPFAIPAHGLVKRWQELFDAGPS